MLVHIQQPNYARDGSTQTDDGDNIE